MNNLKVATILNNIADILELRGEKFKPRAYRNAARSISILDEDINLLVKKGRVLEIQGVGEHIAKKIVTLVETGQLPYYDKLKKATKIDVEELNKIPSLGPRRMKILYEKLKIRNIKDLSKAIRLQKVQALAGFGEETENNLLEGIKLLKLRPHRFKRAEVVSYANKLTALLKALPFVKKVALAGSFRRGEQTIGDLDILVVSSQPLLVMRTFTAFQDPRILVQGATKSSILLKNGLQIDLRVVKGKEYGAALLYFTGSKEHNIKLRRLALKKSMTLNEYGLYKLPKKELVASMTEVSIYKALGIKYLEPEKRA